MVKTKICPLCQKEINEDAIKCRYCGALLKNESGGVPTTFEEDTIITKKMVKKWVLVIIAFIILCIVGLIVESMLPANIRNKYNTQAKIVLSIKGNAYTITGGKCKVMSTSNWRRTKDAFKKHFVCVLGLGDVVRIIQSGWSSDKLIVEKSNNKENIGKQGWTHKATISYHSKMIE